MAEENISQEIAEEYFSSLVDLKNTDKAQINMLSILAKDYVAHAPSIVDVIEKRLLQVSSEIKLPVLYLIDSIMKNVNRGYITLFTKNIVKLFTHVFSTVDEHTRMNMWKLRQTWSEVFPITILYDLDLRVRQIDPAWPIANLVSNSGSAQSLHIKNETNKKRKKESYEPSSVCLQSQLKRAPIPAVDLAAAKPEEALQQQLFDKQKELIKLQKMKVDLELLQAKASLELQQELNNQLQDLNLKPALSEDALDNPVSDILTSSQILKPVEKQLSNVHLYIKNLESRVIAAAKPIVSRDPRLKQQQQPVTDVAPTTTMVPTPTTTPQNIEELAKQHQLMKHQLMQQFKLHMQSRKRSLLNDSNKTADVSEVNQNKRLKTTTSCQKSNTTTTSIPTTSPLNPTAKVTSPQHNSSIKDQSKSSSSTKSSSTRSSSSSKSSSSSSKKSDSKSRSKSSLSKSRSDENSASSSSSLISSTSSSPEKRPSSSKKSEKSHNHSPSPPALVASNGATYRIPRRANTRSSVQAASSNISSVGKSATSAPSESAQSEKTSPSTTTSNITTSFKDVRTTKQRNYVRRNKEESKSPELVEADKSAPQMLNTSKDEDLRALNVAPTPATATVNTKDLDLRVLTVPGTKRHPTDSVESSTGKKSRTEKFDALFGDEDVDLRTLTNPKAGCPSTPLTPVITVEKQNKGSSWANIKSSVKTEMKPLTDRNRGRNRLYNNNINDDISKKMPEGPKNVLPRGRVSPTEKNTDRKIEIIMKQAAEQLNQGMITREQYNALIQEVLHMNEDQKLKAAQRQERESGIGWEKTGNDENMRKEHPMHPRFPPGAQGGPRWQAPWQWGPPPPPPPPPPFPPGPFPDGFRPMNPWNNHSRMFGPQMRPDFHPGPMHPGFNPRMGMMPPYMGPNGPRGPIMKGPMMPCPPIRPDMKTMSPNNVAHPPAGSPGNGPAVAAVAAPKPKTEEVFNGMQTPVPGELPPADPLMIEEIKKDTMKSINIDGVPKEIRYYENTGIVFMKWDDPRDIGFQDGSRRIFIEGKEAMVCKFNDDYRDFMFEGEMHRIKLGTPTRELYIDNKWYECYFGGRPISVKLGNKTVNVSLEGPPPQVKIGSVQRTDLVVGKINIIINAKTMLPVFVDAKPQIFEIEGSVCTLEFTDALQTVLLNGRPHSVDFGGLPKPVIIHGKKHFLRFTVLPRGIRPGYVKITGMKGEPSKAELGKVNSPIPQDNHKIMADAVIPATTTVVTKPSIPPGLDPDSSSQDSIADPAPGSKPDLDVLSSVVPSAMAPASGLSYQAERGASPPAGAASGLPLGLNVNELYQRLVETGIVQTLVGSQTKKVEVEEKIEEEITFDKPETLKIKRLSNANLLYTGMQCSSCGVRFPTEMASKYSQHLDWHFRQNRKEKDSSRKAHSKLWYYDVSDWTQFEEIEDLESRTRSWFETEKQDAKSDGSDHDSPSEAQQPSVPAGSDQSSVCEMCHETFEQFFNEEKEEWHFRSAIAFEGKNYHPLCLDDYKKALEKSAKALEETIAELEEKSKTEEESDSITKAEGEVVEMEEKEKTELEEKSEVEEKDIEVIEVKKEKEETEEKKETTEENLDDSLIEIIEPLPREFQLEQIDDSSDEEAHLDSEKNSDKDAVKKAKSEESAKTVEEKIPDDVPLVFENVKVKEEPLDSDTEILAEPTAVDTTQVAVKSTIDGNVELDSATPTIPTMPSKIKINIVKPLNKGANENTKKAKTPTESPVVCQAAIPLIPVAIKPTLQSKKLVIMPTIEKGKEISSLCSIM